MLLAVSPKSEQHRLLRFFTLLPGVFGITVAVIGLSELIAWALGLAGSVKAGCAPLFMTPITATGFMIAGASLTIAQRRDAVVAKWVSRGLSIILAFVSLSTLIQYAFGWH